MPGTVLNTIHNAGNAALDLSSPQYGHNFFVDATPGTGDLFYKGLWHTWLVGGIGVGGADIYALDVTDPSTTTFNEGSAATVVIGDWNASTISCSGNSTCGTNLGNTFGTPQIRRFHNGMWGVIFGNGFGSSSGDAGIYVMTVNQTSGATTFYYLSTSTGSSSSPNGIAYVTAADLDGDHITDYVYAGDLQGNLWRFDLTSATPASWAVSTGPLFKTQTGQPITQPVVLAGATVVGTAPALIVSFGTGQRTQLTNTSATTYATATQSLYGVWDWNFATWNAASSSQYASLTTAQVHAATNLSSPYTLSKSNLQAQTFSAGSNAGSIDSTNATVTWAQCAAASPYSCNGGTFGWYANLAVATATTGPEQIVSVPTLYQQALIVNSTVPAINNPLSCTINSDTGNTYIISVTTGGTFTSSGTSAKVSGFLTNSDANTVGQNLNETGALSIVRTSNSTTLIGQSNNPVAGTAPGIATPFSLPTNISVNRMTWTQLR
jgi:type IV pilus assembly protein PilY1